MLSGQTESPANLRSLKLTTIRDSECWNTDVKGSENTQPEGERYETTS